MGIGSRNAFTVGLMGVTLSPMKTKVDFKNSVLISMSQICPRGNFIVFPVGYGKCK